LSQPRVCGAALGASLLVLTVSFSAGASRPWQPRKPVKTPEPAHQLKDVGRWGAEPPSPTPVDPAKFSAVVARMCSLTGEPYVLSPPKTKGKGKSRKKGKSKAATEVPAAGSASASAPAAAPEPPPEKTLGDLVRETATEAGLDPFLLAGLVWSQSGCQPKLKSKHGFGLLQIDPTLYRSEDAPAPPGEKSAWLMRSLLDPVANLKLGATLLRMWQEKHEEIDEAFGGVPHRSPVSHFLWGDVVRSSGNEDLVITARRRLVGYYNETQSPTQQTSFGLTLVSPLDGVPRLASSGPGEDRAGGKREHKGIDLVAQIGEPVRAVAAGTIIFAGANMPGKPARDVPPEKIVRFRHRRLGAGGIYLCIEHAPPRKVVTCYMHLDRYFVHEGETVAAGQEIGRVGRTGVKISPPHLHFEIRIDDKYTNPAKHMAVLVIPPRDTQSYVQKLKAKRTRLARVRAAKAAAAEAGKL
jgi:murein DD-endopeptidase MepM/ murein hydrolase activator NlpD